MPLSFLQHTRNSGQQAVSELLRAPHDLTRQSRSSESTTSTGRQGGAKSSQLSSGLNNKEQQNSTTPITDDGSPPSSPAAGAKDFSSIFRGAPLTPRCGDEQQKEGEGLWTIRRCDAFDEEDDDFVS